jgi:SPP1 family predicted phage head-tail adaptor
VSRVARLLNNRVAVWRSVTADDGGGGQSTSWTFMHNLRARLSQPSARERQAAEQAEASLTHIVYLQPSADVRRGDELRLAGGTVLEVTATFQPSESGTYLRADCTARQSES